MQAPRESQRGQNFTLFAPERVVVFMASGSALAVQVTDLVGVTWGESRLKLEAIVEEVILEDKQRKRARLNHLGRTLWFFCVACPREHLPAQAAG
jgi:hypothetical protein